MLDPRFRLNREESKDGRKLLHGKKNRGNRFRIQMRSKT